MAHTDPGADERGLPEAHAPERYRAIPARLMGELAQMLSSGARSLTAGECELVAAYVSGQNECEFCCASHLAFTAAQLAADSRMGVGMGMGLEVGIDAGIPGAQDPAWHSASAASTAPAIEAGYTGRSPAGEVAGRAHSCVPPRSESAT